MKRFEIFEKLNVIFEDVLDLDETLSLADETSANDIDEWDSLTHIQLIVAIEKEFSIKLTAHEAMELANVGEMVSIIEKKSNI